MKPNLMRFELFTDPWYNAENFAEFEPGDVVSVEETARALILRPPQPVTLVRLKNGSRYYLLGHVARQIEASRR